MRRLTPGVRHLACAALLITAAIAATAGGTAVTAAAAGCPPPPPVSQPFVPWGDANSYVVSTGGSFESGQPAWALTGGATVVSGDSASNPLDPATHSRALYLPAGASATSLCVSAPHVVGIVRMFAKASNRGGASLNVEVLARGDTFPAGTTSAGNGWAPTPIMTSTSPYFASGVQYQVRLTAVGGAFTVDDVYLDPHASR